MGSLCGEEWSGQKGWLYGVQKSCCIVQACSVNNCAMGLCGCFCCGRPYGEDMHVDDPDMQFMKDVFWLSYCCCTGIGCGPACPACLGDSKLCCIEGSSTYQFSNACKSAAHLLDVPFCSVCMQNANDFCYLWPPARQLHPWCMLTAWSSCLSTC